MNVLVVEDEKLLNWSLSSSLSKWGFAVQPVFTGNEAVAQIEKSGFDIVLLDYRLPDLDGLSVARLVRKRQPQAAGLIDNYFNKPLDLQQLRQALADVPIKTRASNSRSVPS
jgi:DNA-binding NtrC family response regulator